MRALRPATPADGEALGALYRDHLRTIAAFDERVAPDGELEAAWTDGREGLHAYAIDRDGRTAGFALVMTGDYARAVGGDVDNVMWEFFVAEDARGTGLAQAAAAEVWALHPGEWHMVVLGANERANRFWRRSLEERGATVELGRDDEGFPLWRFRT